MNKTQAKNIKKTKSAKTASELYRGTNRRMTIMIVLMLVWTAFLIAGSVALVIFAIQAYNVATELKSQLKDKSSTLYQVIKEDVSGELHNELETVVNSQTQSIPSSYQSLINNR